MRKGTRFLAFMISCVMCLTCVMNVYGAMEEVNVTEEGSELDNDISEENSEISEELDISDDAIVEESSEALESFNDETIENVGATQDGFKYVIDGVKECATITGYEGLASDVVIPETIDGYPVRFISGFKYNMLLEKITVPDTVQSIYSETFSGCKNLKQVALPNTLASIGSETFYDCISLEQILIPDSVKVIGAGCFQRCNNLQTVALSKNLTSISSNTFNGCSSLVDIIIPDKVEEINYYAFGNCINLQTVQFPDALKTIEWNAFSNCIKLSEVNFPEGLQKIGNRAFFNSGITEINLSNTLSEVGEQAFSSCSQLKRATISCDLRLAWILNSCNSLKQIIDYGSSTFYSNWLPDDVDVYGIVNSTIYDFAVENGYNFYKINSPTGLKVENITENSVKLSWDAVNHVAGYKIYRSSDSEIGYEQIASISQNTYVDTDLDNNSDYYYKVCVYYQNGDEVEGILTNAVKRDVRLIKNTFISYAKVERYTGEAVKPFVEVKDEDVLLKENIDYTIKYENNVNVGKATALITGIGKYAGSCIIQFEIVDISAPALLSVKIGKENKVSVKWEPVDNGDGYYLYRRVGKQGWKLYKKIITGDCEYTDSGVKPGYTYSYAVSAYKDVNGEMCESDYDKTGMSVKISLQQPTLSYVKTDGYNKLKIGWSKVAGAKGYVLYRSSSKKGAYSKIKTITSANTLNYVNTKLEGKKYYYKVRAYCKVGDTTAYSGYSPIKSCAVKAGPISLNKKSVSLQKSKSITLKLNYAYGKVTWKSSNSSVASVTSKGVVKGKKIGKAIITAKYNGKEYKCTVNIKGDYLLGKFAYLYDGNTYVELTITKRYGAYYVKAYGRGGRMNTAVWIYKNGSKYSGYYDGSSDIFFSISNITANTIKVNFPRIPEFNGTYYRK